MANLYTLLLLSETSDLLIACKIKKPLSLSAVDKNAKSLAFVASFAYNNVV